MTDSGDLPTGTAVGVGVPAAATEYVQVTRQREDWERIVRLVNSVVPVAAQDVEDAYDWDETEGPDTDWIESRERAHKEAAEFRDRVNAAT